MQTITDERITLEETTGRRQRPRRGRSAAALLTALAMAGLGLASIAPTPVAAQQGADVPEGCIAPPDGLQGWWSFDGTTNDVTGTQPASTTEAPGPTLTSPVGGRVIGAAEFSGGAVVVDPVDLHLDQELSIDFWMKSGPNDVLLETILDHRPSDLATAAGFAVFTYGGHLGFQIGDGASSFTNVIPHNADANVPAVETGDWVFVAITLDAERQARFFIDGAEVATADLSVDAGGALSVAEPLYIGRRLDQGAAYQGSLDEVEIFNRALSDTEIVEIAEFGKCRPPATCNGLPVTVDLNYGQLPTTGDDVILGTPGPDTVNALAGDDLVCSGAGSDVVNGGAGNDTVFAGGGRDVVNGGGGNDTAFAGSGNDTVRGGPGFDRLTGDSGNDLMDGGGGGDWLSGGTNDDRLFGGPGNNDRVRGNQGRDRLSGGSGTGDWCEGWSSPSETPGSNTADRSCEGTARL